MNLSSETLSISEAAQWLQSEKHFVLALILRGALKPSVSANKQLRISKAQLEDYLRKFPPKTSAKVRSEDESTVWH